MRTRGALRTPSDSAHGEVAAIVLLLVFGNGQEDALLAAATVARWHAVGTWS
jgi:hypothetical protein